MLVVGLIVASFASGPTFDESKFVRPGTWYYDRLHYLRTYRAYLERERELSPSNPYVDDYLERTRALILIYDTADNLSTPWTHDAAARILPQLLSPEDLHAGRLPPLFVVR